MSSRWQAIYTFSFLLLPFGAALEQRGHYALEYKHKKMQDLVESQGYPLEEHFVTTADGYVLGVYRIPCGRAALSMQTTGGVPGNARCRAGSGPPILLQHGLLDSSGTWVVNFPNQSLGFILADAG